MSEHTEYECKTLAKYIHACAAEINSTETNTFLANLQSISQSISADCPAFATNKQCACMCAKVIRE